MSIVSRLTNLPQSCPPPCVLATIVLLLGLLMTPVHLIDPQTTLSCHLRRYQFRVTKPPIYVSDGSIVHCTGVVTVNSCWGRCDSSEVGDYVMPFKISHHPVCSYTGRDRKRVTLSDCEGYPDPTVEVFDASGCECKLCDSDYTSCENLNG
ncbi:glycoprotein hormone beta-5, partial [Biomphalaria pfeifferi]|uniref:Glycoprotein hormone subunit beta domain-containing protein n=2 Tax=Biomphalaria TaxID=6525 RepID=A0A2C9JYF6_BIOGL